jgi:hypothetical protein
MRDSQGNFSIEVLLATLRLNGLKVQRILNEEWNRKLGDLDSNTKGFVISGHNHFWSITPSVGHFHEINSLSPLKKPRIDDARLRTLVGTSRAVFHIYADDIKPCPIVGCKGRHLDVPMIECARNKCKRPVGCTSCIDPTRGEQPLCSTCAMSEEEQEEAYHDDVVLSLMTPVEVVIGGKSSKATTLHMDSPAEGGPIVLTPTCAELIFIPASVTMAAGASESEPFQIQANDKAAAGRVTLSVAAVGGVGNTNTFAANPYEVQGAKLKKKQSQGDDTIEVAAPASTGPAIATISFTTHIKVAIGDKPSEETTLHTDVPAEGGPVTLTPTGANLTFTPVSVIVLAGASTSEPFKIQTNSNAVPGQVTLSVAAVGGAGNTNTLSDPYEVKGVDLGFHPESFLEKKRISSKDKNGKTTKKTHYRVKWVGSAVTTWEQCASFDSDPDFQKMIERDKHLWSSKDNPPPDPGVPEMAPAAVQPIASSLSANTTEPSFQSPHGNDAGLSRPSASALPTLLAPGAEKLNLPEMKKKQCDQEMFADIAAQARAHAEAGDAQTQRFTRASSAALQRSRQPTAATILLKRAHSAGSAGRGPRGAPASDSQVTTRSVSAGRVGRGQSAGERETNGGSGEKDGKDNGPLFGLRL